jgi:hypothetical protein
MTRRLWMFLLLSASLVVANGAYAIKLQDTKVVVPIIGRFTGANATQWRTDLFIGHRRGETATITIKFYSGGAAPLLHNVTLPQYSSIDLADVVLNTFGLTSAAGPLEIESNIVVEARARIYNAGNAAGEFGQGAPGLGMTLLSRQSHIYGLSGINGNRVNIGITNPNDTATTFTLYIADRDNNPLYRQDGIPIGPHQSIQYNDIFARFSIAPTDGVQVQFNTPESAIYGYASQVRNDTGDAIFLFGTNPNV